MAKTIDKKFEDSADFPGRKVRNHIIHIIHTRKWFTYNSLRNYLKSQGIKTGRIAPNYLISEWLMQVCDNVYMDHSPVPCLHYNKKSRRYYSLWAK